MDAENESDMMAMMGFGGFDSTKVRGSFLLPALKTLNCISQGKPVQGNQEGSVSIKKQRTWRQYMNRSVHNYWRPAFQLTIIFDIFSRGGFNRYVMLCVKMVVLTIPTQTS
jgi:U4/U6.U5 small nuclear ribonucleoproteins